MKISAEFRSQFRRTRPAGLLDRPWADAHDDGVLCRHRPDPGRRLEPAGREACSSSMRRRPCCWGVMSLPAGWASDRFGAPIMMVVMFAGMGLSSIACGLVPTGDTLALSIALCGIGSFAAIYHWVGIAWVIRTAKEQGHAMGVNGRG